MQLGSVGSYDGRLAEFDWVTSLAALGIRVPPARSQSLMDVMYTTLGAVRVAFKAAASGNKAGFNFAKAMAVATQGFKTAYEFYPLGPLEQALVKAISAKQIEWDMNWVIVTELWKSDAFATLISGAKGSSAEISTSQPTPSGVFNVADISVGVKLSKSDAMGYHGVAEKAVNPFFEIHKLIHDRKNGRYYLKRYGRNTFSFWPLAQADPLRQAL